MSSPVRDPADTARPPTKNPPHDRSSDEEGTTIGDEPAEVGRRSVEIHEDVVKSPPTNPVREGLFLNVSNNRTSYDRGSSLQDAKSPSQAREEASRFDDELQLLQVERQVSHEMHRRGTVDGLTVLSQSRSRSNARDRSRRPDIVVDEFDVATNPIHVTNQIYQPPENPTTKLSKFFKQVHNSSFLVRYFTYITPVALILLIPLLIGALVPSANGENGSDGARVGGVSLLWFMIWLEIVWLTLWLGRLIAKCLPYPIGIVASLFTNTSKKWRDLAKQLELAATLFFWWLAIEISFLPTMIHHQTGGTGVKDWQRNMNKVLIAFLVAAALNLIEKLIIQLIAISFHERTYEDRIQINQFQIGSLTKLYSYSKTKLRDVDDSDFEPPSGGPSGARTPAAVLEKAQKNTQKALNSFGDVAGKIAGDFTGRAIKQSTHPSQVVISLLNTTGGSQVLARRLYRTFNREETETIHPEELLEAFETQDECDAAFSMFDKDMNGDISMEELEAVCVEIGRERKAIVASLKDLDSVVSKLDNVFMFLVIVISILVLVALISSAAASGLSNAGSIVLGLSWLFSATATEFLQSIIFVFVKHPFDVGDRVTIYGQTGASFKGDDYYVKEIALLYTEFKKMEGQVVQAPNSYLNTLFILNMRRSGGLAEAVPMTFKFGTTIEQIDLLRQKLLEFVKEEKREYQANILTELRDVVEAHSITLNVVFFYKSNWQNELLRLQRRNKFVCALMVAIQECGIEGPRMRYPGQKDSFPLYMQNVPFSEAMRGKGGNPDFPDGLAKESQTEPFPTIDSTMGDRRSSISQSVLSPRRERSESIAQQARRYDFSLGASDYVAADAAGDVYDDVRRPRIPITVTAASRDRTQRVQTRQRASQDVARSSSVAFENTQLRRATTDAPRGSGSVHRNRFFPHRLSKDSGRPEIERMETGMAGIPEGDTPPDTNATQRIDPRSGLISPRAVRLRTDESIQPEMSQAGMPLFQTGPATAPPDHPPSSFYGRNSVV